MPSRTASSPVSDDDGSAEFLLEFRRIQERSLKQATDAKKAVFVKAKLAAEHYEDQVNKLVGQHEVEVLDAIAQHEDKETKLEQEAHALFDELKAILTAHVAERNEFAGFAEGIVKARSASIAKCHEGIEEVVKDMKSHRIQ